MTLTLELPNELASYLTRDKSAEELSTVTLDELLKAIKLKEQEADDKIADALLADYDPEREEAEIIAIIEEELKDIHDLSKSYTLEELRQEWEAEKAAKRQ